jgi:hypothetical protein
LAAPTSFSPAQNGGCEGHDGNYLEGAEYCDSYSVTVTNTGAQASSGGAVTIRDVLPVGLTVKLVELLSTEVTELGGQNRPTSGVPVLPASDCGVAGLVVTCSVPGRRVPDAALKLQIFVTVNELDPAPRELTNVVAVEGGGAAPVSGEFQNTLASPPPTFGLSALTAPLLGVAGEQESQAGAHPYELPVKLDLNSVIKDTPEGEVRPTSVQDLRDAVVDLPLGVGGSALAAPQCTLHQLSSQSEKRIEDLSGCPADTIVGYVQTYPEGGVSASSPIYNIVPEQGFAAELGYLDTVNGAHVIDVSVAPTPEGYVLRSTAREVPQIKLDEVTTQIYGDPAARDKSKADTPAVAMFTDPSDCSGQPLKTTVYMDSWQDPAAFNADGTPVNLEEEVEGKKVWVKKEAESAPPVTGCSELAGLFEPEIAATPESTQADSPTGLQVNLKIPQNTSIEALGTPPVRNTVVTLPEGFTAGLLGGADRLARQEPRQLRRIRELHREPAGMPAGVEGRDRRTGIPRPVFRSM